MRSPVLHGRATTLWGPSDRSDGFFRRPARLRRKDNTDETRLRGFGAEKSTRANFVKHALEFKHRAPSSGPQSVCVLPRTTAHSPPEADVLA